MIIREMNYLCYFSIYYGQNLVKVFNVHVCDPALLPALFIIYHVMNEFHSGRKDHTSQEVQLGLNRSRLLVVSPVRLQHIHFICSAVTKSTPYMLVSLPSAVVTDNFAVLNDPFIY